MCYSNTKVVIETETTHFVNHNIIIIYIHIKYIHSYIYSDPNYNSKTIIDS